VIGKVNPLWETWGLQTQFGNHWSSW